MTVDVQVFEQVYRLVLSMIGIDCWYGRQVLYKDLELEVEANPDLETIYLSIKAGCAETEVDAGLAFEKGATYETNVVAPEIPTFPGQTRVKATTFPVKLRIVTLPHKSRAKIK